LIDGAPLRLAIQLAVFLRGCSSPAFCHGELYRSRPREHLTAFYLTVSAGGALGNLAGRSSRRSSSAATTGSASGWLRSRCRAAPPLLGLVPSLLSTCFVLLGVTACAPTTVSASTRT
jgi:hypothetical protein